MLAHERFHIQPWGVGAFGKRVVALIHLVVENLESHIRDADVVNIGEDERDPGLNRVPIFDRAVEFAAYIATGLLNLQQDAIQFAFDLFRCEHGENYIRGAWVHLGDELLW